jgi:probable rRNA maturation factor
VRAPRAAARSPFRIDLANQQQALPVDRTQLVRLVRTVLAAEGVTAAEISLAVVDDATMHRLNRQYLDHDWPTDVISFALEDRSETGPPAPDGALPSPTRYVEGEVIVSSEMALRTADELGCAAADELCLYVVHGLLHVCGYDDQEEADRLTMRERERTHLQKLGITPH